MTRAGEISVFSSARRRAPHRALVAALLFPGFVWAADPANTASTAELVESVTPADTTTDIASRRAPASFDEETGILTFDRERLASVVAECNRHNEQQLVIADEATGDIEIGGRLNLTDLPSLLARLRAALQVQASVQSSGTGAQRLVLSQAE